MATAEDDEIWYPIPSLPGYDMSSEFRIRTWRRQGKPGKAPRIGNKARILSVRPDRLGYMRFSICLNGKYRHPAIHQIVAELAYGCKSTYQNHTRHFDGNVLNNYASNLAMGSASDNWMDSQRHGTAYVGSRHHSAKLTESQVRQIRFKIDGGMGFEEAGRLYGISVSSIRDLWIRRTWRHVV